MKLACPHCLSSWVGAPIPLHHQEHFGGHTYFNDAIAITIKDTVAAWECPDCHSRFDAQTWERQTLPSHHTPPAPTTAPVHNTPAQEVQDVEPNRDNLPNVPQG